MLDPYEAQGRLTGKRSCDIAGENIDRLHAETPYGPIGKVLRVGEEAVPYVCPLALLWTMASASEGFGMFLLACLGGAAGDFILYLDDVRPGNILRPDPGRVYYSILWSLAQYPRWYAARMMGWLPHCFVQSTQLDRIDGGISQVIAALLQVLWDANARDARPGPVGYARLGPAMNLASLGVRIPSRGAHRIIKLVFRALLADEKGLHEVCMSKTASGLKPCVCCMNIIGRRRPDDIAGDWGIHFSQAGPDDVQLYDAASFARMLEEVRRVMEDPASSVKDKREIQTLCGINYSSTGMGIIWGPAQDIAQVPECICYDWMHNVCASGGVGAHNVNQIVRVVAQAGVTLADITAFIQKVVQPKSNRTLRSFKFEQRIADKSSAPSELLRPKFCRWFPRWR